jgi:hypothetical protein
MNHLCYIMRESVSINPVPLFGYNKATVSVVQSGLESDRTLLEYIKATWQSIKILISDPVPETNQFQSPNISYSRTK